MTAYAVGDLQGCFSALLELLDKLAFDWRHDTLWVCGDIVNRGPQSLNTLRYLYEHRQRVRLVLGNHDLHMLAMAHGLPRKSKDTFYNIVDEPANQDLIDWLLQQPLVQYEKDRRVMMVHAGVPMHWTLKNTLDHAAEVSQCLQQPKRRQQFFHHMYGNQPSLWSSRLTGFDRLRYITNALTRMRYCYLDGSLELRSKVAPGKQPSKLMPWYRLPIKIKPDVSIIFGHWASLNGQLNSRRFQSLDTGYVWGGSLTALNLDTWQRTSVHS